MSVSSGPSSSLIYIDSSPVYVTFMLNFTYAVISENFSEVGFDNASHLCKSACCGFK